MSLMEAVADAARAAGAEALARFRKPLDVRAKADGTPVSGADLSAEAAAIDWIERRFPRDGILSEERGLVRPDAPRRWIVDPIDGTSSFVRGVPLWGSLVAVMEDGEIVAGAAEFPALGERIAAGKGQGAWSNGSRCAVSSRADVAGATILTTAARFPKHPERERHWNALASRAAVARRWGDCFGYLLVATGRAEAMVDPVANVWDVAPMLCIVEEAGGAFTDWRGVRTASGGDAIATNRALADAIRIALGTGQ